MSKPRGESVNGFINRAIDHEMNMNFIYIIDRPPILVACQFILARTNTLEPPAQ